MHNYSSIIYTGILSHIETNLCNSQKVASVLLGVNTVTTIYKIIARDIST